LFVGAAGAGVEPKPMPELDGVAETCPKKNGELGGLACGGAVFGVLKTLFAGGGVDVVEPKRLFNGGAGVAGVVEPKKLLVGEAAVVVGAPPNKFPVGELDYLVEIGVG